MWKGQGAFIAGKRVNWGFIVFWGGRGKGRKDRRDSRFQKEKKGREERKKKGSQKKIKEGGSLKWEAFAEVREAGGKGRRKKGLTGKKKNERKYGTYKGTSGGTRGGEEKWMVVYVWE